MLETSNQQCNSKGKLIKRCNHRFLTRQSCKTAIKVHTDIFYLKNLFVTLYITKWFHRVQSKLYVCKYVEAIGLRSFIRFFVQVWWDCSRRVRTHEKNSKYSVRRWGTITIHNIFYAQSGASIRLTVPKNFTSRHLSWADWLSLGLGEVRLKKMSFTCYYVVVFSSNKTHISFRVFWYPEVVVVKRIASA